MKVKSKIKFSALISDFSVLWMEWMKHYNWSINDALSFKKRRAAGEKCEKIIKKRYQNINQLNDFFNHEQHRGKN